MKKLKRIYKIEKSDTMYGDVIDYYPNMSIFRRFRTTQEKYFYYFHTIEYKHYSLKLRMARSPNRLPNSWWDVFPSSYKVVKSWKHNSKRCSQYYK